MKQAKIKDEEILAGGKNILLRKTDNNSKPFYYSFISKQMIAKEDSGR